MKTIKKCIQLCLLLVLSGCSAGLDEYQDNTPKFDLFEYFSGQLSAWGMVQDRFGLQTRRFEISLTGTVKGDELILVEDFVFDDGEKSQRIWRIRRTGNGEYQGQADDIIGVAMGREVGNALHWRYEFNLPYQGNELTVTLDDWLYRQDDKRVFNLTQIKKWGIDVGHISLFFQKQDNH